MKEVMILWEEYFLVARYVTKGESTRVFIPIGTGNCYEEISYKDYQMARNRYLCSGE